MSPVNEKLNIAFSGCGFLAIYHVGVVACMRRHAPAFVRSINKYGGASAGALNACLLLFDSDFEENARFVMDLASEGKECLLGVASTYFDPSRNIRQAFMRRLPPNAYKTASGKLHISLTRVSDMSNVIINEFKSNKDMVDALICSSFVPVYSGFIPPKFRGVSYIDGGFTDNLPQHFEGTTITVSPFSGESDICPDDSNTNLFHFDMKNTSIQFTSHNLYRLSRAFFPPSTEVLCEMCRQGFRDALKYLHIHYPHLLDISIERIQVPNCCTESRAEDDRSSTYSCDSDSACSAESTIAERWAVADGVQLLGVDQLYLSAKDSLGESEKWALYIIHILTRLLKWMARPAIKSAENVGFIIHSTIRWMLPRLSKLTSSNRFSSNAVALCAEVCHTYKGWYQQEKHPSLNDDVFESIHEASERIKLVQRHLKAVPIRCKSPNTGHADTVECASFATLDVQSTYSQHDEFDATFSSDIEAYIQKCRHAERGFRRKKHADSFDEFVRDFVDINEEDDTC